MRQVDNHEYAGRPSVERGLCFLVSLVGPSTAVGAPTRDAHDLGAKVQLRPYRDRSYELAEQSSGDPRHSEYPVQSAEHLVEGCGDDTAVRDTRCSLVLGPHRQTSTYVASFARSKPKAQPSTRCLAAAEALAAVTGKPLSSRRARHPSLRRDSPWWRGEQTIGNRRLQSHRFLSAPAAGSYAAQSLQ